MQSHPSSSGFRLLRWSAWAPGLATHEAWSLWASQSGLPAGDDVPAVKAMPPMLRRRAERLGKMLLETLFDPAIAYHGQPMIHASRHGEAARTSPLLVQLAHDGTVSPQAFSMAVHNATAGLFTIATQSAATVTAIAAGRETTLAGLTEALGQLADGAGSMLLCFSDEPLPAIYRPYADAPEAPFSFVLELTTGDDFILASGQTHGDGTAADAMPLDLLRFLLSDASTLALATRGSWQLIRTGATA